LSINSCSINEYTINTLCGRRRQAIINSLRPPVTSGGQQQHVANFDRLPYQAYRRNEEEHIDVNTLEQPFIQVTIDVAGQSFAQTIERDLGMVPVISVYAVSATTDIEEQVNIIDFHFKVI
jgi:hypothetical protein